MTCQPDFTGMAMAARLAHCVRLRELRRALERHGVDPDALLERYEAIPQRHRHRRRALLQQVLPEDLLQEVEQSFDEMNASLASSIHVALAEDGQALVTFRLDGARPFGEHEHATRSRRHPAGAHGSALRAPSPHA